MFEYSIATLANLDKVIDSLARKAALIR